MNEETLRTMIQSMAPNGVSTTLRARAIETARRAEGDRRRRIALRWSLAGTALAAGVVAGLGSLAPKASAASLIARAESQADALGTAHWTEYDAVKGGTKIQEGWFDHGKYRQDDGVETVVRLNGRFFRWAWGEPFVMASDGKERPSLRKTGDFRASTLVREESAPEFQMAQTAGRTYEEGGRHLAEVVSQQKGISQLRYVATFDTDRDLLVRSSMQRRVGGRWEDSLVTEYDFGGEVSAAIFHPKAFQGKPVVDFASLHDTWERKLQRNVATLRVPLGEIRVHDVWRNERGWVFVLYTRHGFPQTETDKGGEVLGADGQPLWDPRVWMEDDRGVPYARALFDPSWSWNSEWQPAPLRVDGQKMEGLWMVPAASTNAHTLRLSFDETRGGKRRRLGTLDLAAPPAAKALTPPYAPLLSLYPFDANMARQMEAYAFQRWWNQRWVDARGRAVPGLDDGDRVGAWGVFSKNEKATPDATLDPRGKAEGLAWTYRLLDAQGDDEKLRNERFNNGSDWYRAYGLALDLGRTEEAEADLRHARERNPESNYPARS